MGNTTSYWVVISDKTQMGTHVFRKVCRDNQITINKMEMYCATVNAPIGKGWVLKQYCSLIDTLH